MEKTQITKDFEEKQKTIAQKELEDVCKKTVEVFREMFKEELNDGKPNENH